MAAPIAHFISSEVRNFIEAPGRLCLLATLGPWSAIPVVWMKTIVDVPAEAVSAVKPGASAQEDAAVKPLRPVVTIGSALIRRGVIVSVRAFRSDADLNTDLRRCFWNGKH